MTPLIVVSMKADPHTLTPCVLKNGNWQSQTEGRLAKATEPQPFSGLEGVRKGTLESSAIF